MQVIIAGMTFSQYSVLGFPVYVYATGTFAEMYRYRQALQRAGMVEIEIEPVRAKQWRITAYYPETVKVE